MTRNKISVDKELRQNLKSMQDMFTSTALHSTLNLKGGDSDVHNCQMSLSSGDSQSLKALGAVNNVAERKPSLYAADTVSDSGQSSSYPSSAISTALREWGTIPGTEMGFPHNFPAHIPRHLSTDNGNGNLSSLMEAARINSRYQPPRRGIQDKPIACFYVLPMVAGTRPSDGCHRALYLTKRTRQCLVDGIAKMCNIEPAQVVRTLRFRRKDLIIHLDDESVREIPEGQDMAAQFHVFSGKRRLDGIGTGHTEDGFDTLEIANPVAYELWLIF